MDLLTFQVQLEQLTEDMKHDSVGIESANRHFKRIGRYLLIGKEFLAPNEYQGALKYCGLTEDDAAFALQRCSTFAMMDRHRKEIQEHADDLPWLEEKLEQIRKELEQEEE